MAATASGALYRGRAEPLGMPPQHLPHNLAQYVAALEHRVQMEQTQAERALSAAPGSSAARIHRVLAGVRLARRMAADMPAPTPLSERIDVVRRQAEALLPSESGSGGGLAPSVSKADAFWDEYLYAELMPPAPPPTTFPHDTSEKSAPEESTLRQRRPGPPADAAPAPDEARGAMASERTLQEALSSELLRMASVLRQNSAAFADALERDRVRVEQASTGLEQNLDLMTRTRGQLGVFTKKARRMGWFTLGSIASVVVCWVCLFVVIRLT
ncbi:hypothetical protein MNAN1_002847 [Malassezia nana]|uniref:Uncharacterized protein n=1 Tax=Malassezia nana TaxID=180528 RepID=A0AAF0ES85_9BASI|nr:hypothetical protein MNAN1_002847 [Malassezia nana]